MKRLKSWQIALLIIFYPVGIIYLIVKFLSKRKGTTVYSGPMSELNNKVDKIHLNNAKKLSTDLVEASYHFGCCSECAKYRGRLFSITGQDKRFPKKPDHIKCTCQGIDFYPFVYGLSEPIVNDYLNKKVDIIKFSNRPFKDDRTPQEKETFAAYQQMLIDEKNKEEDRLEYNTLLQSFPTDMPKSFGAYRRMKNSNSIGFAKIRELAKQIDFEIKTY